MRTSAVVLAALACLLASCNTEPPLRTVEILLTSEAGDRLAPQPNIDFRADVPAGPAVRIFPAEVKQTVHGIGTSFTESSAYVLAHLPPEKRREVMRRVYGAEGANFSLARTHVGACDFTVDGRYSYADVPGDTALAHFSIAHDTQGFPVARHPGVRAPSYDLLPMIREALAIKAAQDDSDLRIVASAWTAPAWMKDVETWYVPGSAENDWQGSGGELKRECVGVYADYLVRYLDAYAAEGVSIWGLTPVNEPHGNGGHWESMNFSPESQNEFVKNHLGPALHDGGHGDVKLMIYDQNRDGLEHWTDVLFADPETAPYVYGAAVHWYASTFKTYAETFDRVHAKFPDFALMHTEGCIDDLGKDAPEGFADPAAYKESGWFGNDAFWWNAGATDWAYGSPWGGVIAEDHPVYTPVHRYARNVIDGLDHWLTGWIDWNIVLDAHGGPNHVGNFCGAPIMIDTDTDEVYYTPVFHVLSQFSRTIRPGDRAVATAKTLDGLDADALHACATVNDEGLLSVQLLNTTKEPIAIGLGIDELYAAVELAANSVTTVRVALPPEDR